MTYVGDLQKAATAALTNLRKQREAAAGLTLGGKIAVPKVIRVPSFADSKFQAEQALGDWAETCLAAGVNRALSDFRAVHYGFSSKTIAGEPGFKEEYQAGFKDTCEWGKRADLLLLPTGFACNDDISSLKTVSTQSIVAESIGCIEVRSSRTEAKIYMAYQKQRLAEGIKVDNPVPNFTVKVEDLVKIYRWIEVFEKPQIYAQVFLDQVYGINVLDIFEYIARTPRLRIIEPQRSRKVTIYVPITEGVQFGDVTAQPTFEVENRLTANGRHDIYARPSGGRIDVAGETLLGLLRP